MNSSFASAGVPCPAPGAESETESAFNGAVARNAALMPILFPIHQLRGFLQLILVSLAAGFDCIVDILGEQVKRIHVQLGGQILKRRAGDVTNLRVTGGAPGSLRSGVGGNRGVIDASIWNASEDVREQLRVQVAATDAASGPGLGLPSGNGPVFLAGHFHFRENGGAIAGYRQLSSAIKEEFHRLAAAVFGKLGR